MSVGYTWVQWNRHKRVYDAFVVGGVALFIAVFVLAGRAAHTGDNAISDEVLVIRAFGLCAVALLHIVLCIGPLARLDRRFAALLYNRRHLGVTMFLTALAHALLAIGYYGGFGTWNPFSAMLSRHGDWTSLSGFPFEVPGLLALLILFVMAATSHDFWLVNLTPRVWKALHMGVYVAYALVIMHAALGFLQSEQSPVYVALLGAGALVVCGLHIATGALETWRDGGGQAPKGAAQGEWIDIGTVDEIPEKRAKVVCLRERERIAVFRHDGKISAISNVCAHQAGPLGEGKIIDGCVTCPWHGYQYLPANGQSPPPYTEKIPTYRVRIEGRRVLLNPEALPPGTPVEPAQFEAGPGGGAP